MPIGRENTNMSRLSSEDESDEADKGKIREREEGEVVCARCGGRSFKVRVGSGGQGRRQVLECESCGKAS